MRVPGGCCSNGCHGYCLGSLEAPFRFTRHLLHGFNLIFIKGILKKVELSYPRLQRNQHSGSCIGMSGIGSQLATDEEHHNLNMEISLSFAKKKVVLIPQINT